ncbi:sensor histidine kinase [Cerasicoccus fimbriatus]|uniref:sensor histidine kinase n=1 Tax=Cerasicoccus fimbriatus TaxID=3014554 RepID=UPI0022B47242|nr:HAMP domain-containing sensor histidine kinase [Cerasicoccus sp. TK19100]
MKFRPILLAWFLLLGATLSMGGGAWWLLNREADRVDALANVSLANSAASVAESVDLLMEEIRGGVMDGLLAARQSPQPRNGLAELVANNPYVQVGFYFRGEDGVTTWYGERGDAPSPAEIQGGSGYPWSMDESEKGAYQARAQEFSQMLRDSFDDGANVSPTRRQVIPQAPTDVIESNVRQLKEESAQVEEPEAQQADYAGYNSKSAALRRQRESVRFLNDENVNAVLFQKPVVIPAVPERGFSGTPEATDQAEESGGRSSQAQQFAALPAVADRSANVAQGEYGDAVDADTEAQTLAIMDSFRYQKDELTPADIFVGSDQDAAYAKLLQGNDQSQLIELARRLQFFTPQAARSGWLSRDIAGEKQWLAWVDLPGQENILGAWLNRETLIAEMAKTISISQQSDVQFALIDDAGQRVAGDNGERYMSSRKVTPALTLDVGAALPGWRIEAYPATNANPFGRGFRLLGGMAVVGLSLAILLGGSLLMWQSQRDALEAQRKTTFVANVSHELKTPLTSIRLFAEMLYDGRAGDEAKRLRYLQTMLNETQRLTRLVNNVLDFSRLERGRRDFQHESVDVGRAVEDMLEMQRDRLSGEGLALEFKPPSEPIQAEVDRDALEQILLNLLDNAAKYANSGERAVVSLARENNGWHLSVCDFGPGIPARERQQVFEAFHRIDDRLTADRPGCGLGLSIAARLAEGMGGRLHLAENDPQGCCFSLIVSAKDSAHV